jgi:hypothetical protein
VRHVSNVVSSRFRYRKLVLSDTKICVKLKRRYTKNKETTFSLIPMIGLEKANKIKLHLFCVFFTALRLKLTPPLLPFSKRDSNRPEVFSRPPNICCRVQWRENFNDQIGVWLYASLDLRVSLTVRYIRVHLTVCSLTAGPVERERER